MVQEIPFPKPSGPVEGMSATRLTAKDPHTLSETACGLTVIEHRLRDVRRWIPEIARAHLDALKLRMHPQEDPQYGDTILGTGLLLALRSRG